MMRKMKKLFFISPINGIAGSKIAAVELKFIIIYNKMDI